MGIGGVQDLVADVREVALEQLRHRDRVAGCGYRTQRAGLREQPLERAEAGPTGLACRLGGVAAETDRPVRPEAGNRRQRVAGLLEVDHRVVAAVDQRDDRVRGPEVDTQPHPSEF